MTELKQSYEDEKSFLAETILVKKENGELKVLDSFDTGATTRDDMAIIALANEENEALFDEKKADRKQKIDEKHAKISADFESFKAKFKKDKATEE